MSINGYFDIARCGLDLAKTARFCVGHADTSRGGGGRKDLVTEQSAGNAARGGLEGQTVAVAPRQLDVTRGQLDRQTLGCDHALEGRLARGAVDLQLTAVERCQLYIARGGFDLDLTRAGHARNRNITRGDRKVEGIQRKVRKLDPSRGSVDANGIKLGAGQIDRELRGREGDVEDIIGPFAGVVDLDLQHAVDDLDLVLCLYVLVTDHAAFSVLGGEKDHVRGLGVDRNAVKILGYFVCVGLKLDGTELRKIPTAHRHNDGKKEQSAHRERGSNNKPDFLCH